MKQPLISRGTNGTFAAVHHGAVMRGIIAVAAAFSLAACGDSTGVDSGEPYPLATVNDRPLPAPHPESNMLEITSGRLTVQANGAVTESVSVRCRTDLPAGAQCTVTQPTQTRTGTINLAEGWIRLGDRTYPVTETGGRITAEFGPPPSSGVFLRASFSWVRN